MVCCVVAMPMKPCASSEPTFNFDFDISDPVEYRARIMTINYAKAQLVVGEHTIQVVDLISGEQRFTTALKNANNEALALELFQKGDLVLIEGLKQPDGSIIASIIQKLNP
jgi:hypothetical protein